LILPPGHAFAALPVASQTLEPLLESFSPPPLPLSLQFKVSSDRVLPPPQLKEQNIPHLATPDTHTIQCSWNSAQIETGMRIHWPLSSSLWTPRVAAGSFLAATAWSLSFPGGKFGAASRARCKRLGWEDKRLSCWSPRIGVSWPPLCSHSTVASPQIGHLKSEQSSK
jgi:hypothetical protein